MVTQEIKEKKELMNPTSIWCERLDFTALIGESVSTQPPRRSEVGVSYTAGTADDLFRLTAQIWFSGLSRLYIGLFYKVWTAKKKTKILTIFRGGLKCSISQISTDVSQSRCCGSSNWVSKCHSQPASALQMAPQLSLYSEARHDCS